MRTPLHPLAASAGFGIASSLLVGALLPVGGLAPIVFAALIAAVVGVPVANTLWSRPSGDPLTHSAHDAAAVVLLAVFAASAVDDLVSLTGAVGLWGVAYALRHRILVMTIALLALGIGSAALLAIGHDPLPVLEPQWTTGWLPQATLMGLLAAGVGTAGWATGMERRPGDTGTAWAVVGLGVGAMVVAALGSGVAYAASMATHTFIPGMAVLGVVLMGALAWLVRAPANLPLARRRALIGVALTLWFIGPAADVRDLALFTLVPLLLATTLIRGGLLASNEAVARRWLWGAAVLPMAAAAWAWDVPASMGASIAAGFTAVGVFWILATASLRKP